jgi:hypothetical protein
MTTAIRGEAALADFRARLTGRYGLELVRQHGGRAEVQLPVGVGKSRWMDAITFEAATKNVYDLVVVLAPTRQLVEERAPLRSPPVGLKVINIRPRPARRCGRRRNAQWKLYDAAGMAALGREEICGTCPRLAKCYWPRQYGKSLRNARIVYATQSHLERDPSFLISLRSWVRADRMLTLLDETNFIAASQEETITAAELQQFIESLRQASPGRGFDRTHQRWRSLAELLAEASTVGLQEGRWRAPPIPPAWAAAVQRTGVRRYGTAYRFPAYRLSQLRYSPTESRRRGEGGAIQFAARPYVGDCLIFSGTADPEFTAYRLGKGLASPFSGLTFSHPGTRWYNIASPIGARRYFARHAPQLLDFFAGLVVRRAAEGRRALLVVKKLFAAWCANELAERFAALGADLRVVTEGWTEGLLQDPRVVPLITFGMIGTNLFEHFDVVYCLSGFYVHEGVVNQCLQDVIREDLRLPIRIETVGSPKRRLATVADPAHRFYDIAPLAQPALEQQEHHVVVQAVGRVRPFTRPREVITFQMGALPGVAYDAEFRTLGEARRAFGILSRREQKAADLADKIAVLRGGHKSQVEVAKALGISVRTVRNYERKEDRQ